MRARTRSWRGAPGGSDAGSGRVAATRTVPLGDLPPGAIGTISRLGGKRQLRRRLMDMGIVAGTRVQVERVAPLGDPIEIRMKGFHLSLRKDEAGGILVEVPDDEN